MKNHIVLRCALELDWQVLEQRYVIIKIKNWQEEAKMREQGWRESKLKKTEYMTRSD
jgi:hypothetical protein